MFVRIIPIFVQNSLSFVQTIFSEQYFVSVNTCLFTICDKYNFSFQWKQKNYSLFEIKLTWSLTQKDIINLKVFYYIKIKPCGFNAVLK